MVRPWERRGADTDLFLLFDTGVDAVTNRFDLANPASRRFERQSSGQMAICHVETVGSFLNGRRILFLHQLHHEDTVSVVLPRHSSKLLLAIKCGYSHYKNACVYVELQTRYSHGWGR